MDELPAPLTSSARRIDVRMTIAGRSPATYVSAAQQVARWRLDNCYSDYAVTNARQFMDLLSKADVPVAKPEG